MATEKTEKVKRMRILALTRLAGRIVQSNLRELSLPYRLTYAVTNRCQARCAMCNIWKKPTANELSLAEIDLLFSKASHFSWINLTGGELFQRPDITDIFLTIIQRSPDLYLLNFPTNGLQTDEIISAVDAVLNQTPLPRLIVSVSMDGPPELHDTIRGVTDCWNNAIETFRQLRQRRSGRFSVYLGYTMQAANPGKFDATLQSCRSRLSDVTVDDFHLNLAHASGHYYDNADTDALPDTEPAIQEIERVSSQKTAKRFDPVVFIERHYQKYVRHYLKHGRAPFVCEAAAASCFIDPTGIVYPCSVFDAPLGSLREHDLDLSRLWLSIVRRKMRESIKIHGCPGCWTPCEAYQTILANLFNKNRT